MVVKHFEKGIQINFSRKYFLRTKFIFKFEINSVQQAELKEVMKKDRRTYSQGEIKKLFTDMLHKHYLMG